MNKQVLIMELRRSLKSLIIWTVAVGLTMVLIVATYPLVKEMLEHIPAEFQDFIETFGGLPDNAIEYYATEGGITLQLLGAIFAALLGFSIATKETREKTSDLVFSLPVSRKTIFLTKVASIIIRVVVFSLAVMAFILLSFVAISGLDNIGGFMLYMLLHTLMLIMVALLGFALGAGLKNASKQMLALVIPFPLYILFFLSTLTTNEHIMRLKHITPFTFSDPVVLLKDAGDMDWISLIVFIGLTTLAMVYAYYRYLKKEFKA